MRRTANSATAPASPARPSAYGSEVMLLPLACTDRRTGEVIVALAQPRPSEARMSPAPAAASSAAVTFARVPERAGRVSVDGAAPVTLPVAVMGTSSQTGRTGRGPGPGSPAGAAGGRAFLQGPQGVGGGDDAGSGLDVRDAVTQQRGADRDGGVGVPGEVQVADAAAVQAAPGRFELVDDLHRAGLRRPGEGAGRERGQQHVQRGAALGDPADDRGDDVHHVAVALDRHEVDDLDGPGGADPAQV